MIDISNAKILSLAIHEVGNKSKDEKLILTDVISTINNNITEQYIKKYFFSSFNFDLSYQFYHESEISLNEIYTYSSTIFAFPDTFIEQSKNIAKHLYEVSTHPNIKRGELYIAFIKNCVIDGYRTDAVGIFKSETKDFYLDVKQQHNFFDISCKKGINTKKLDKGCLIFDYQQKVPKKVYIVDTSRNDALYWKNNFLKITKIKDTYTNTTDILNMCKKFINKTPNMEKTNKISFLNNSVQYFESHDNFEFNDFTNYTCENENDLQAFKTYIKENDLQSNFEGSFEISKQAVTSIKKKIRNFIKLDSDIEIKIPSKIKAVEEVIEQGYDTEKQMWYYKIYYVSEK